MSALLLGEARFQGVGAFSSDLVSDVGEVLIALDVVFDALLHDGLSQLGGSSLALLLPHFDLILQ